LGPQPSGRRVKARRNSSISIGNARQRQRQRHRPIVDRYPQTGRSGRAQQCGYRRARFFGRRWWSMTPARQSPSNTIDIAGDTQERRPGPPRPTSNEPKSMTGPAACERRGSTTYEQYDPQPAGNRRPTRERGNVRPATQSSVSGRPPNRSAPRPGVVGQHHPECRPRRMSFRFRAHSRWMTAVARHRPATAPTGLRCLAAVGARHDIPPPPPSVRVRRAVVQMQRARATAPPDPKKSWEITTTVQASVYAAGLPASPAAGHAGWPASSPANGSSRISTRRVSEPAARRAPTTTHLAAAELIDAPFRQRQDPVPRWANASTTSGRGHGPKTRPPEATSRSTRLRISCSLAA